jgi:(R,R)-butanediol dehydrogenase/meso-butanediol dehydrogenase/diacetyl reductase
MRAIRLHAVQDLRVEDIDPPQPPKAGEVTLAVTAAGICGSDLHNFKTGAWISRAPSVAGHEFTGTVAAIGPGVAHVAVGQRVIVDSRCLCGDCPACREGFGQVCDRLGFVGEVIDGGFAERVTLPARNVMAAPDDVPDRYLAMAEPLAVALHAVRRLAPAPGAVVAITGCGPIGGFAALLARRAGHPVKIIDRNEHRAALVARATGAEVIRPEALPSMRIRFAVETTGSHAVLSSLVDGIAACGSIALVGIGSAAPVIDPVKLVEREIALLGSHAFNDADLQEIRALLPKLRDALEPFVAEQIPLSAVPDAYARHLAGSVKGLKTIVLCDVQKGNARLPS